MSLPILLPYECFPDDTEGEIPGASQAKRTYRLFPQGNEDMRQKKSAHNAPWSLNVRIDPSRDGPDFVITLDDHSGSGSMNAVRLCMVFLPSGTMKPGQRDTLEGTDELYKLGVHIERCSLQCQYASSKPDSKWCGRAGFQTNQRTLLDFGWVAGQVHDGQSAEHIRLEGSFLGGLRERKLEVVFGLLWRDVKAIPSPVGAIWRRLRGQLHDGLIATGGYRPTSKLENFRHTVTRVEF